MIISIDGDLTLMPYEKEKAIVLLEEGKTIIPLWLDKINQELNFKVH